MPEVSWNLHHDVPIHDRQVDVLYIEAPTVLAALETTHIHWSAYPLRILDAPKGGGKTYALARLAGRRAICVSDRKALAAQIAAGFGGEFRRDPGSSRRAIRGQTELADRFSCTLHTTPRLEHRNMSQDTLIVDEAIHVLGTMAIGTELRGPRRRVVYDAFLSVMKRCKEAWFAQASWSHEDVAALLQTTAQAGRGERVLLIVVKTPEQRGLATEMPNMESLRDAALSTNGPRIYCSTSRKSGERVQQEAIRLGMDPLVVSGRTLHSLRVQRWLANPIPELESFVILSPTVISGLSIHTNADGFPAYSQVFMEFCTWPKGLPLDDALQIVARVRGAPQLFWWASSVQWKAMSAEEHLKIEEKVATASSTILKEKAAPVSGLDQLAAMRLAANEASLGPNPRTAFARGLARDGWTIENCVPAPAAAEARTRWRLAKQRALTTYLEELVSADRGPVDQQTVSARLSELGLPSSKDALSDAAKTGIEWLERNSPGDSPINLLAALLNPEEARSADTEAHHTYACRHDLPHTMLQANLIRTLLYAANIDFSYMARGGLLEVRSTDLSGFTSAAHRYADELNRLFGIQAPAGRGGAIRALGTLLGRFGAIKIGSRRPAAGGRVRVYTFKLSPIALEAMKRRLGSIPTPPPPDSIVFARTATDVLCSRVPLRLSPEVAHLLPQLRDRLTNSTDTSERARLTTILKMIEEIIAGYTQEPPGPMNWLLFAKRYRRGDAGRIQLLDSPLQNIPKSLRSHITPELSGDVFVSADFRSCHVAIAAARTGDGGLYKLLQTDDAYSDLANRFMVEDREKMKEVVLAMLNGAGPGQIMRLTNSPSGRTLYSSLISEFPGLQKYFLLAKQLQAAPGNTAEIPTLSGTRRTIKKRGDPGGWKRLQSAFWMGPESEALDHVLASLPIGARLVAPMHDGLLVCCAREDAERVAAELRTVMVTGAQAAGFEARVKVGIGETWADAEELAR